MHELVLLNFLNCCLGMGQTIAFTDYNLVIYTVSVGFHLDNKLLLNLILSKVFIFISTICYHIFYVVNI